MKVDKLLNDQGGMSTVLKSSLILKNAETITVFITKETDL
jgi:hypothetical protein